MAVTTLRELHLLAEANTQDPDGLDAHPLVREHFADRLRTDNAEAWKAGHNRLYEYLTGKDACPKEYPDTIEEMQPLYAAVIHGCLADRHQEALDEVYCCRIQRGDRHYNWKMLGAYGADLGTLTGFFDELWSKPVATINESDQGLVLNEAAFDLRALGRLAEAVEPFRVGLDMHVAAELWSRAARMALNLNDLQLTLGDVETAMKSADRSVEYANRGEDAFVSVVTRADLANTLHEQGRIEEAEALFQKAESIQKTEHGHEPFLYSKRGFQYCDFLLGKGGFATVIERALRTIEIAKQNNWLLDIALDHLSIGRALLGQAKNESTDAVRQAWARIDTAVDGLREAGQMDEFPRGLLARAELYTFTGEFDDARADLDEAMNIATRDPKGPMRLHITDCHLGYARLALARGAPIPLPSWSRRYAGGEPGEGTTREHLVIARKLIEETGYHRRDGELEEFERQAQRE